MGQIRSGVHTLLKDISPKVNVIAWLEFELAFCDVAVQHVSHFPAQLYDIKYSYLQNWNLATRCSLWLINFNGMSTHQGIFYA